MKITLTRNELTALKSSVKASNDLRYQLLVQYAGGKETADHIMRQAEDQFESFVIKAKNGEGKVLISGDDEEVTIDLPEEYLESTCEYVNDSMELLAGFCQVVVPAFLFFARKQKALAEKYQSICDKIFA